MARLRHTRAVTQRFRSPLSSDANAGRVAIVTGGGTGIKRENVDATWDVTQRVAERWMIPRRSGFIAFLGFSPRRGIPSMIHSSMARSALETFAAGIAQEWSKYSIRAVCVAAGLIQTEGSLQYGGQAVLDEFSTHAPMRRPGLPE